MDISVLGPLEVRRGDTAVHLGAPKLRVLLLSLVLDVGRVVHADRLIEDLWADDPPPQPLVSLRSYVSNLRRLLQVPGGDPVIATRSGGYALEVPPDRVDARRFETLAGRGRDLVTTGDPAGGLEVLTDALSLWRGAAYADVADEPRARPTIVKLEELRRTATEDRAEALLATGRHREAIPELEAFVGAYPSRERALRQLVLALYRAGRAPDALRTAAGHRAVLVEEFGLDPSPQLAQLTERILRQDPRLDPPATSTQVDRRPSVDARTVTPAADDGSSALVGRAAEGRALDAALATLDAGAGGALLVAGEPGIGKTALLEDLTRRARARHVPVLWGRCLDHDGAPPFWPWLEVLRAAADHLDDDALRAALAGPAAQVTQLLPELAARTGTVPAAAVGDPEAARFAIHDGVATFLTRVAGDAGMVVVLDDLHWADGSSLQLLALLATRAADGRILVATSHRDVASDRTPELETALAATVRATAATSLRLRPLARDEVAELVQQVTGTPPPDAVLTTLHGRADGNPFFVHQLAALLAEEPDGDGSDIPAGVRHVLLERLHRVPDRARRTLATAAVLGQEFDVRSVALADGVDVVTVLDDVDVAIQHGLVEVGGEASTYRFVHALVRDTIHDELTPGVTARLHAAVGTALEQLHPVPVEAVADHLWRAAGLVEPDRLVHHLRAAADEAVALLAFEQAEQQLRRALVVLERRPDADPSVELAVRLQLVQVMTGLHGWSAVEREEVIARVRQLAGRAGIGAELIPLWWSLWSTAMTRGDPTAASELATELLAEAVRSGDAASLVAGHVATAYTGLFAGDPPDDVLARLERASQAAAVADPAALARTPENLGLSVRANICMAHAAAGDVDAALRTGDELVRHATVATSEFQQSYARMFAAWSAALVDRPSEALTHTSAGLTLCEQGGYSSVEALVAPLHAWAATRAGADPVEQAARMADRLETLVAAGHRHAIGHWYGLLAEVRLAAGDVGGARAALADADEVVRRTGEQLYAPALARVRGLVEAAAPA